MKKINHLIRKLGLIFLAIFLILVVTFFLIQKGVKELDQSRVALVDKIGNNYVFRGNNPLIIKNSEVVFAYDELTSYFNNILQEEGLAPLGEYYLIDISLLDWDQFFLIKKEEEFFAMHHEYGEVINYSTLSPRLLLEKFSNYSIFNNLVNNYDAWVTDTLETIHDLASKQTDKPVVVYIHCDSGRDRTGLMISGYRLLFNDIPLRKIRMLDLKEVRRSSVACYDDAIRTYCTYVRKTYNKPDDYCTYLNMPSQE